MTSVASQRFNKRSNMVHSVCLGTPTINVEDVWFTSFGTSGPIDASPEAVFAVLLDFESYPAWNSFNPHLLLKSTGRPLPHSSTPKPGDLFVLKDYNMGGRTATSDIIWKTLDSDKLQFSWGGHGMPGWMCLRPERVQEVIALPNGKSEYRTWESMAGWSAAILKWVIGSSLDEANSRCCADLKRRVEQLASGK